MNPNGFPKGKQWKRHTKRKFLTAMPSGTSFVVQGLEERNGWLNVAYRYKIPLASVKRNGDGYEIIRLKYKRICKCPRCGWEGEEV